MNNIQTIKIEKINKLIRRRVKIELYGRKNNIEDINKKYHEIKDEFLLPYAEKFLRSRGLLNDVINGFNFFYLEKAKTLRDVVFSKHRIFVKLLLTNGFRWADTMQGFDFWQHTNEEYERYLNKI